MVNFETLPAKMSSRHNSNESTALLNLINGVKKHALLYDKSNDAFTDKAKKAEAWKAIGSELNLSGEACRKNFTGLRDNYGRQLKLVRHSKGTVNAVDWPYMDAMSFLNPHIVHKSTALSTVSLSPVSKQPSVRKSTPLQKKAVFKKKIAIRQSRVHNRAAGNKSDNVTNFSLVAKQTSVSSSPPLSSGSKNFSKPAGIEDGIVHEEEEMIPDEADTMHEESYEVNDDAETTQHSLPPPRLSTNYSVATENMSSVPMQVRKIVDSLEELLLSSVENSKQPHDDAYYFGMNIACRLRQLTRKNMSIAQAEIQYRLRQIELENNFT